MTNLSKQNISANDCLIFGNHDSILICALFTLNPNTTLFKKLNLSNKSSITTPTLKKILNNKEFFSDLYDALNNKAIRQLAYTLLSPIFIKNYTTPQVTTLNYEIKKDLDLLEKYLEKFQYTYFRYFFPINDKIPLPSTNKELNTKAIKALFLILGI